MHEIMDGWNTVGIRSANFPSKPFDIVPTSNQRVVITALYLDGTGSSFTLTITGSVTGDILLSSDGGAGPSSNTRGSGIRPGSNVTNSNSANGIGESGYIAFIKGETVTINYGNVAPMHVDYQLQEEI